jgi:glycosyltransferase involved in cell wall biosynthesis
LAVHFTKEKVIAMEIIHVVLGKGNPARMNGVNKVVHELASHQALAGERVTLWGITGSTDHDYPERPFDTRLFKAQTNLFALDPALLAALDEKTDGAVFHLHGGFIPTYSALAKALNERNIPFVFTPHGSYNVIALKRSQLRKIVYLRLYERTILKFAQTIHCLGKSEMDGVQRLYPNNKSVLIPYGFETDVTVNAHADPKAFIFGFCGRIDIYTKGLDLLLNAFFLFLKEEPSVELWIIGDSPDRLYLQELATDLDIDRNISFYGGKYGDEKLDLLSRMHVFVHPSRNEGLPSAVLEAASLGIPCIVTEATNMGASVRQYGCGEVVVNPNANELFQAMRTICQNIRQNGMEVLSANARRMVSEGYNWNRILQHFHQLYRRA